MKNVLILVLRFPKSFFHIHQILFFQALHYVPSHENYNEIQENNRVECSTEISFKIPKLLFSAAAKFLHISVLWVEIHKPRQIKPLNWQPTFLPGMIPFFPSLY